jgi:hypothetical protein
MKLKCKLLVFNFLILPILLFANSDIRKQFHKGLKNKAEIEKIIKSLEVKTTKSAVELGYLGAKKWFMLSFSLILTISSKVLKMVSFYSKMPLMKKTRIQS